MVEVMLVNLKEKRYRVPFSKLKANKKCTADVFRGSTALRKVSLIDSAVKMSEIRYKYHI